jgi:hypothetical protein
MAVGVLSVATPAAAQSNVLRVVPHSNLAVLDPIWTTAYMSRNHGYMIYDTLFGTDEKGVVKPQMVESYSISTDNRMYTFKLRKGLEFHDGQPVTGEDVIASLQRWGKRDAMGSALMQFVSRMDSPSPDTFRIFLGEACGFVLEALGKPSSNVPFMMPKKTAETDPMQQIKLEDVIGSGPFVFKGDEWKPGEKIVFIGDCAKYEGTVGDKVISVESLYRDRATKDPHEAKHDDILAKIFSVRSTLREARNEPFVRLEGCPVSVAEQVLALVMLGGTKNPYLSPSEAMRFNKGYLMWKSAMAGKRLRGIPYQKHGAFEERGESAPE